MALFDQGYEINLIFIELYKKGKRPIDIEHRRLIRAANNLRVDLYGAYTKEKVIIGDDGVVQNFLIHDMSTYLIILGQPFIIASQMENELFLIVFFNHEINHDSLRDQYLLKVN